MEIFGNRWSNVQLITAAEDHPNGRQLLRCRLRARWSLQAAALFWSLLAVETIVVGFLGGWKVWLLPVLLTVPLFGYFMARQKRHQQSLLVVFLDELAEAAELFKVPDRVTPSPAPPTESDPLRVTP